MAILKTLDSLLRGGFTDTDRLRDGHIALPVKTLVSTALLLGAAYGLMMGFYSLATWDSKGAAVLQMISSAGKVPLLFLLTLLVTFPSLYVVSALARTRLGPADTARLLLVVIVVDLALLASLGPITAFFTVSTDSYPFMVLLNVLFFGVAGIAGLTFLRRSLGNLLKDGAPTAEEEPMPVIEAQASEPDETEFGEVKEGMSQYVRAERPDPALIHWRRKTADLATVRTRRLMASWCILFGVVGSQMGWVLRPFIGSPDSPFEWFRARDSNFLAAVFNALGKLFS